MKQITLDFATYEAELNLAELRGRQNLLSELKRLCFQAQTNPAQALELLWDMNLDPSMSHLLISALHLEAVHEDQKEKAKREKRS